MFVKCEKHFKIVHVSFVLIQFLSDLLWSWKQFVFSYILFLINFLIFFIIEVVLSCCAISLMICEGFLFVFFFFNIHLLNSNSSILYLCILFVCLFLFWLMFVISVSSWVFWFFSCWIHSFFLFRQKNFSKWMRFCSFFSHVEF